MSKIERLYPFGMKGCAGCGGATDASGGDHCPGCVTTRRYAAFALSCGLDKYPDPSGERYLFDTHGDCACKKGECPEFIDELWNALCEARGRLDLRIEAR